MSSQHILLGPPFPFLFLILKFNHCVRVCSERNSRVFGDGKDIEADLANFKVRCYPVADEIKNTVREGIVSAGAVVDGSGLETVKFKEGVVDDGEGNKVVDVIVFGCGSCFVTLEGV